MKKNILIAILAVTTFISIAFGLYQRTEAVKYKELADLNAREAMVQKKLAEEQRIIAEHQSRMAQQQIADALKEAYVAKAEALKKKGGN